MLVLTRKLEESVIIDENIEIKVLEIKGEHVRLGISAPCDISIYRKELYDRIKEINLASQKGKEDKIAVFLAKKEGGDVPRDSGDE